MIASQEQYIVDHDGNKTAVILSLAAYEALLDQIAQLQEDLHGLAVVAQRRHEPTITLDELQTMLPADGILAVCQQA